MDETTIPTTPVEEVITPAEMPTTPVVEEETEATPAPAVEEVPAEEVAPVAAI